VHDQRCPRLSGGGALGGCWSGELPWLDPLHEQIVARLADLLRTLVLAIEEPG
jgi:hypothetical protein